MKSKIYWNLPSVLPVSAPGSIENLLLCILNSKGNILVVPGFYLNEVKFNRENEAGTMTCFAIESLSPPQYIKIAPVLWAKLPQVPDNKTEKDYTATGKIENLQYEDPFMIVSISQNDDVIIHFKTEPEKVLLAGVHKGDNVRVSGTAQYNYTQMYGLKVENVERV